MIVTKLKMLQSLANHLTRVYLLVVNGPTLVNFLDD